ncbi:PREDICTED: leukocyte immunoglobulin-like receptor subfamily A member 5 isoform X1 [Capra hircus]|uniref:leukocyte immunoglobulin-like receptor subfamily A member 5 isoform X1 n=1 Tax=Capra hircus TaxID=9925 RepID=UPI000847C8D2|nr:PREDICTED: leukocyte immunoglobulin-like receptor subfamily A member 5 isoform X1 [Capra hircus]
MRKTRLRLPTPCGLSVRRAPRSPPSPQPGPQGGDAMAPTLPALLCLGLSVGLRTQVQAGTLRKPTIWAEPGSVVTRGSPVTIWCQGPPNADSFSLNKEGTSAPWNAQPPAEPWDRANFFIKRVTEQQAGRYHCSHFIGVNWSEPSEPLELLVAGEGPAGRLRDSPSLSVQPGPSVTSGENVTLLCQSENRTDTFLLSKEGAAQRPLRLRSQDQDGRYQAEFSLSPVTSAHGGTYRCYRSLSTDPYLLSQPSEPLALLVSDYTVQNLIRMGLAASVLLLLGILLCQARHDHGGARDKARS